MRNKRYAGNMENAGGAALLVLSLDAAIKCIYGKDMVKAKGIIVNIMTALNFKYSISYRLLAIYEYVLGIINAADVSKYAEASDILTRLREAWQYAERVSGHQAASGAVLTAGLTYGRGGMNTYASQDETGGFFA